MRRTTVIKCHIKCFNIRKDIKVGDEAQSFETDDFILSKAKSLVQERLWGLDPNGVSLIMRCLYQNTPDKVPR